VIGGSNTSALRESEVSLVALATVLVRHVRLLVAIPAVLLVLVAVTHVLLPKVWVAKSRLLPEPAQREGGQLAGIAAQLALNIGGGGETESLDFYADLVTSSSLLDSVALTTFRVPASNADPDSLSGTLLDILAIRGSSQSERLQRARTRLRRDITIQLLRRSGMFDATTRAVSPALAEALNRRVLELVSDFNQERRQSRASAERLFVEGRLAEVRDSLAAAQARLIEFGRRNRSLTNVPPDLFVERSRLEQDVELLTVLQSTLAQSYERARLDEVRNTPILTAVDSPEGTARPEGGLARRLAIALVVGLMLAMGVAFVREHVALRERTAPEEISELRLAWRQLWHRGRM
jgi:uncharacterized protein involved in exopolysaccharide biosynthesis